MKIERFYGANKAIFIDKIKIRMVRSVFLVSPTAQERRNPPYHEQGSNSTRNR
jgi:hypothetical protein